MGGENRIGSMWRNVIKFFGVGLGVAFLGLGTLSVIDYVRYKKSPEYRAVKELEKIKKEYAEDPYGGETPEETLRFFVEALKKGDTELAAKYFVLDKQEEWREELARIKDRGVLGEMMKDLERVKKSKSDEKQVFFSATNEEQVVSVLVDIQKHVNGKWKIADL